MDNHKIVYSPGVLVRIMLFLLPLLLISYGSSARTTSAAGLLPGFFSGEAYAAWLNSTVLPVNATVGKLALTPCPCLGTNGQTLTNQLNSLNASPLITTGVVKSTTMATKTENKATFTNSSEIAGLNLFNGLISADAIRAATKTVATATSSKSLDNGSSFVNLKVAGKAILDPAVNSKIDLAGLGYVVLKETSTNGNGQIGSGIQVRMVHVYIKSSNAFNLPIGAEIILGHAASSYYRSPIKVVFRGAAFSEEATSSAVLIVSRIGQVAPVYVPCQGTGGATLSNTIASVKVKDLLTAGVGTSTAVTNISGTTSSVKTTSTVQGIKLLNGLVTADSVIAVSESKLENGQITNNTNGSKLVNLKILGLPIVGAVPPNTRKDLLGFGYVVLKEVQPWNNNGSVINMIHLYITTQNIFKIPVGTEVQLGVAASSIAPVAP